MPVARTSYLLTLFLLVFLQVNFISFSQNTTYPTAQWVEKLSDKTGAATSGLQEVWSVLKGKDSAEAGLLLRELERKGNNAGKYFSSRFHLLKGWWLADAKGIRNKESVTQTMKQALNAAYETDNDSLISFISWQYGTTMYYSYQYEPATLYCLYSAEIDEKSPQKMSSSRCELMGDLLYRTQDYQKSIYYTHLAIVRERDTSYMAKNRIMSRWNTIGLCWQKMGNYDSAFLCFDLAFTIAKELKNEIWVSIISGNKGQVYFMQKKYAIAKPLLEADYRYSKSYGEMVSAGNSLQWVARINLLEGKKDSALTQVKEALRLIQLEFHPNYLQNVYYTTADVYRAFGNYDSVYKYSELYNKLHDSIERAVARSALEISRIKLDNLQNALTIKNLHKEKEAETLKRNFILATIILIAAIIILILTRQRQKLKYQQRLTQSEMVAAKEQLNSFTQNLIEKSNLIENLQLQLQDKEYNETQQQVIDELSHQSILTEDDWAKFKSLFEKIHPGFFIKLKQKSADITLAEQRTAALTRLEFPTRQIASLLGISVDSVHKARQRLRQRYNFRSESELEEFLASL
jgi:DNA-binding CsgD family transcriptional regulator/tetratricopeptide (TPR) repeat protein